MKGLHVSSDPETTIAGGWVSLFVVMMSVLGLQLEFLIVVEK